MSSRPNPFLWTPAAVPANANNPSTNISGLRSQAEFFLGGVVPVDVQPDECSICTDTLDSDVVKILGHMFHLGCVLSWFKANTACRGTCPNCRCELYEPDRSLPPAVAVPRFGGSALYSQRPVTEVGSAGMGPVGVPVSPPAVRSSMLGEAHRSVAQEHLQQLPRGDPKRLGLGNFVQRRQHDDACHRTPRPIHTEVGGIYRAAFIPRPWWGPVFCSYARG
jgi:hypothetical protein